MSWLLIRSAMISINYLLFLLRRFLFALRRNNDLIDLRKRRIDAVLRFRRARFLAVTRRLTMMAVFQSKVRLLKINH